MSSNHDVSNWGVFVSEAEDVTDGKRLEDDTHYLLPSLLKSDIIRDGSPNHQFEQYASIVVLVPKLIFCLRDEFSPAIAHLAPY